MTVMCRVDVVHKAGALSHSQSSSLTRDMTINLYTGQVIQDELSVFQ